ncbi:hypothetical protein AB0P37_45200 [Streptomyces antimycoticus]|uniref:hypothetical protein n=1 Tax=Streptomyces antimycoticus TaxID=68175 RepID=UPI003449CA7E
MDAVFHRLSIIIAPRGAQLGREKSRGRPQDLVRPLELGVLLAQGGQLLTLGGGEGVASSPASASA